VMARFAISSFALPQAPGAFPFGTLVVNLVGCFLIGIAQTLLLNFLVVRAEVQLFVSVGLLGGFTTFSTFSVETVQLVLDGKWGLALMYQFCSLAGGLAAVLLGVSIANMVQQGWTKRPPR